MALQILPHPEKEDLREEEKEIIKRTPLIFGCDACQNCCPYNRKAPPSPLPEIHEKGFPFSPEK